MLWNPRFGHIGRNVCHLRMSFRSHHISEVFPDLSMCYKVNCSSSCTTPPSYRYFPLGAYLLYEWLTSCCYPPAHYSIPHMQVRGIHHCPGLTHFSRDLTQQDLSWLEVHFRKMALTGMWDWRRGRTGAQGQLASSGTSRDTRMSPPQGTSLTPGVLRWQFQAFGWLRPWAA